MGNLTSKQIALLKRIHTEGMFVFASYGAFSYYWGVGAEEFYEHEDDKWVEFDREERAAFRSLYYVKTRMVKVYPNIPDSMMSSISQEASDYVKRIAVDRDDYFEEHIGLMSRVELTEKGLEAIND